jgi:hypothetical protein
MLDTVLDAADDRHGAFVPDIVSLVIAGLGERARVSVQASVVATTADAAKLASMLSACLWVTVLTDRYGWRVNAPYSLHAIGLLAVVLLWALGRERLAGMIGVACTVALVLAYQSGIPLPIAVVIVPAVGYLCMSVAPRRKRPDPSAVAALAALVALGMIVAPEQPGAVGAIIVLTAVSVAGVLAFPVQPRLAIAAAIIWTAVGIELIGQADTSVAPLALLVAAAPAVLAATAARAQLIRRRVS